MAQFAFGELTARNKARALVYARALCTSINTTFGTQMQQFCNEILSSIASVTDGMDIEFYDAVDGRYKYCQVKAGPNNINKSGREDIVSKFRKIMRLAKTNRKDITNRDCVVGVLYGTRDELNVHYINIENDYPVYIGQEFWYHLTGDSDFYDDLIDAFAEGASECDGKDLLEKTINALAKEIEEKENEKEKEK